MKVRELMRSRPRSLCCIRPDASMIEAGEQFLTEGVSSLLVCKDDTVLGIFTKNDMIRNCLKDPDDFGEMTVAECMTTDLYTTTPDADLEHVIHETLRRGFHHIPVLDGDEAVGMVTPIDILLHQKAGLRGENEDLVRYVQGSY